MEWSLICNHMMICTADYGALSYKKQDTCTSIIQLVSNS